MPADYNEEQLWKWCQANDINTSKHVIRVCFRCKRQTFHVRLCGICITERWKALERDELRNSET